MTLIRGGRPAGVKETTPALCHCNGDIDGVLHKVLAGEDGLQPDEDGGCLAPDWELLVQTN